jgi:hypothetical protein
MYVYAVARTKNSDWPIIEVWPIAKVWKHRDRINKVGNDHYSFKWPEAYAKKIPLLQVLKYVPRSVELATALSLEEAAETGGQQLGIKDVPTVIESTAVFAEEEAGIPLAPAKDEQVQNPPKEAPAMCSECREIGNHKPDCKYAGKTEQDAKTSNFERIVVQVVAKKSAGKCKLVLASTDEAGKPLDLFVWHEHLIPELDKITQPTLCAFEVSTGKKGLKSVQHVLAIGSTDYVDDKPAEKAEMQTENSDADSLFEQD